MKAIVAPVVLKGVHRHGLTACDWSDDGRWIVLGDSDGVVSSWDMTQLGNENRVHINDADWIAGVGIEPDGANFHAVSSDGLFIYESLSRIAGFAPTRGKRPPSNSAMALSPDGKFMAVVQNNKIFVFNLTDGTFPEEPVGTGLLPMFNIRWHPDSRHLVTSDGRWNCILWNVVTHERKAEYDGPKFANVTDIDISPSGNRLMVCFGGELPREYDLASGNLIRKIDMKKFTVSRLRYGPEGNSLAMGVGNGADEALLVTSLSGNTIFARETGYHSGIGDMAFTRNGELIVLAAGDGNAYAWNYEELRRRK